MFHWALTAAAVLALVYAIRVLFTSARQRDAARQRLGFGFSVAAAGLWIYVLRHHFGELGLAIRLAGGVLLILPAVSALASPARGNILRALLGLFLAVLLAGPAVERLWSRYGPDTRPARVQQLAAKLKDVRVLSSDLAQRERTLFSLRTTTAQEIQALGENWKAIEANPVALEKLELLSAVRDDLAELQRALTDLHSQEALLQNALEADSALSADHPIDVEDQVELLRRELGDGRLPEDAGIVERHLRTQELRDLYEQELGKD